LHNDGEIWAQHSLDFYQAISKDSICISELVN
jgi:hypothetical protein